MPHRIPMLLTLALMALSSIATPVHARPSAAFERQTVAAVNDVRADHGLKVLRRTDCLSRFAHAHARRMAQRQALFHQDLTAVARACRLRRAAENVAAGYHNGQTTVRSGWMESEGHRANILTRAHRLTAAGSVRDAHGTWWTVQILARR